jgi:uncharacterized membrane protein
MDGTQQRPSIFDPGRFGIGSKEDAREADLVATWFARIGAMAVLIGAGFGYKFAVDRGLIGPGGRVALGALAAIALIVIGERTAIRGWNAFAQAVMGGGTALLYLTAWAAFHQYGLIEPPVAFALLAATAGVGAVLSMRHDSQALALLATIGAFANPVVVGSDSMGAVPTLGYILTVDLCVLGLAYLRGWDALTWVGALASWALFGEAASRSVPYGTALVFASIYHVLFAVTAVMSALRKRSDGEDTAGFLALNAAIYVSALITLTTPYLSDWLGGLLAMTGAAYLGLGVYLRSKLGTRAVFVKTSFLIGAVLAIAWVPVQFDLRWIPAIWSAEGATAVFAGYRGKSNEARFAGAILMVVSAALSIVSLADGSLYETHRLVLSTQSLAYVVHAGSLFAGAFAMLRFGDDSERQAGLLFLILANAMTLIWMSLEAAAYVGRTIPVPAQYQTTQFLLTVVWALYACALVTIGVIRDSRAVRWLGVGLFGGTIVKLVVSDVWLLSTGYRTVVFIGVGALLLICSLQYSRFKELISDREKAAS